MSSESDEENVDLSTDQSHPVPVFGSSNDRLDFPSDLKKLLVEVRRETSKRTEIDEKLSIRSEKEIFEIKMKFRRIDLFRNGLPAFSHVDFPFRCLCFLVRRFVSARRTRKIHQNIFALFQCASAGKNLIFCNGCCQSFHKFCLTELERPRFEPTEDFWLCPKCEPCRICGATNDEQNRFESIRCGECRKTFHFSCLNLEKFNVSPSQRWFCSSCLRCDCGRKLKIDEHFTREQGKSLAAQKSMMCDDCLIRLKKLSSKSSNSIEKCHFCHRFIEHLHNHNRPLFSLDLIGQRSKVVLFQCDNCQRRFHPVCDDFINEDILLFELLEQSLTKVICSKCDSNKKNQIQQHLYKFKVQTIESVSENVKVILKRLVTDENEVERVISKLIAVHKCLIGSINLHAFLIDILSVGEWFIRDRENVGQWFELIDDYLKKNCRWFSMEKFQRKNIGHFYEENPSDHNYCSTLSRIGSIIDFERTNFVKVRDCLLNLIENPMEDDLSWSNSSCLDDRTCEICGTLAEENFRLISIGVDRWAHGVCLFPICPKRKQENSMIFSDVDHFLDRQTSTKLEEKSLPIYVDLHGKTFQIDLNRIRLSIGALKIVDLGNFDHLLNVDVEHSNRFFPDAFRAERVFWSTKNVRRKTIYRLKIEVRQNYHQNRSNHENPTDFFGFDREKFISTFDELQRSIVGRIFFRVSSDDGENFLSENLDEILSEIVGRVRDLRDDFRLKHLSMSNEHISGLSFFGFSSPVVQILLKKKFLTTFSQRNKTSPTNFVLPLIENSSKLIFPMKNQRKFIQQVSRLIVYQRKTQRRQTFSAIFNDENRIENHVRSSQIDSTLLHVQLVRVIERTSVFLSFRQILLKEKSLRFRLSCLHYFSQRALIVGRSKIHGCGLFTLVDLFKGQMIIEYIGEVVRPCLTDVRERRNEKDGIGCYMFTVDAMNVIDATRQGNRARFINHHCQPNSFAKTIICAGVKHVVIYALVNIDKGSEITYDYAFPEEEVKIPCFCANSRCRMFLN